MPKNYKNFTKLAKFCAICLHWVQPRFLLFILVSFMEHFSNKLYLQFWRDSILDCQSIRRTRWPLYQHHRPSRTIPRISLYVPMVANSKLYKYYFRIQSFQNKKIFNPWSFCLQFLFISTRKVLAWKREGCFFFFPFEPLKAAFVFKWTFQIPKLMPSSLLLLFLFTIHR